MTGHPVEMGPYPQFTHPSQEEALTLTSGTAMWLWSTDSGEGDAVRVRCVVASAFSTGDSSAFAPLTSPLAGITYDM